jgi:division/cell wall cluster transcriptional repressor MraZ
MAGESPAPIPQPLFLSGVGQYAIDPSNRIMIPPEWRAQGLPPHLFVVLAPADDHLVVCPLEDLHALLTRLRINPKYEDKISQLERELNDRVRTVDMDRFGRLPLPPEFLARAKFGKQGCLIGRFCSKFEVWPPEKYQALQNESKTTPSPLDDELSNF